MTDKNKRITKNTLALFFRMSVLMIMNLYIVRILMQRFGVEGYGVQTAVAGVITSLTCLNNVISTATMRFLAVTSGRRDNENELPRIFSASLNINIAIAVVVLLLFETIGVWFVNAYLNIPAEILPGANWLYQFAVGAFLCTIIQIPFLALVMVKEDMGVFAAISTVECCLKLIVAFCIGLLPINVFAFYGLGLFVIAVIVLSSYVVWSKLKYSECKYKRITEKTIYKELLSFSGWTFFGSLAAVFMFQGNTVLLNVFFGAAVTAAFGVALQINSALGAVCNAVVMAVRPAMIKAYGENNFNFLNSLFFASSKYILVLIVICCVPLFIMIEDVLRLWLGTVNEDMVLYSRLIIVYFVLLTQHYPITIIMQAVGVVKQYHVSSETIMLACLPVSFVMFISGLPSWSMMLVMIAVCGIAHAVRLVCLKKYYGRVSVMQYLFRQTLPIAFLSAACLSVAMMIIHYGEYVLIARIIVTLLTWCVLVLMILAFGLNSEERSNLSSMIKKVICK